MKRILAFLFIASVPLAMIATVYQTARFQSLRAQAIRLEDLQRDWIEQNRKLSAGISILSARARADEAAQGALGLTPVRPEGILRIKVEEKGSGIDD